MLFASLFQKASQPSAARAAQGHDFPPLWDPPIGCFFIFSPACIQTTFCTVICILQILCFLKCACMFLQCFPSKHGNFHICRHKTVPKHIFFTMSPIPLSPQTLENTAIYTVFFNFSMFQCRWPTQTYIQKSFKNIIFYSIFTMFSVKNSA